MAYISTTPRAQTFKVSCGVYKHLDNRQFINIHSEFLALHLSIEEAEGLVADIQGALADLREMEAAA